MGLTCCPGRAVTERRRRFCHQHQPVFQVFGNLRAMASSAKSGTKAFRFQAARAGNCPWRGLASEQVPFNWSTVKRPPSGNPRPSLQMDKHLTFGLRSCQCHPARQPARDKKTFLSPPRRSGESLPCHGDTFLVDAFSNPDGVRQVSIQKKAKSPAGVPAPSRDFGDTNSLALGAHSRRRTLGCSNSRRVFCCHHCTAALRPCQNLCGKHTDNRPGCSVNYGPICQILLI